MKPTLLFSKGQVMEAFDMDDYISAVEDVFRDYGNGKVQMPPKMYLTFPKGDLRSMPAYLPSMKIAGVKNVNVHPENLGMPSVMATITLFDPETGFPLAMMDGTHITNMRTGAAGGVAAKYLSREDSKVGVFVGAGEQAKTQLEALLAVRPGLERFIAYDPNKPALDLLEAHAEKLGREIERADSLEKAVREADILVTTTPVREPIIKIGYLKQGVHINAIGADAEGKQELDSIILKRAKVVIDNWEQASHSGEINVPVSKGWISQEDIHANIGEIATGKKPGRVSKYETTVFDSTGLAVQDIACAAAIYKKYAELTPGDIARFHFV
jgi:alanine dehydrogenase